jgi:hydroxymethylpyrimidine/phosphomethylpyrimidine kinase
MHPPIVLAIAGHDPCGGAGIQADIEAISANGCRAATVITCLTVQDTRDVMELVPVKPALVEAQARAVLADLPVAAIKIGLIGDGATAGMLAALLTEFPRIPVVLDPVLAAGGGTELAGKRLLDAIRRQLLPQTTLITPNSEEARRLGEQEELEACAGRLLSLGCGNVLITGTHEEETEVINRLFLAGGEAISRNWPRLPGSYHGSGCTLASAIAAGIALGRPLPEAVAEAQSYTWQSLTHAHSPGRGQALPDRLWKRHD